MIEQLIDLVGDREAVALGRAITGVLFGALAQRSRFCSSPPRERWLPVGSRQTVG